jgi:hypothetical protein
MYNHSWPEYNFKNNYEKLKGNEEKDMKAKIRMPQMVQK